MPKWCQYRLLVLLVPLLQLSRTSIVMAAYFSCMCDTAYQVPFYSSTRYISWLMIRILLIANTWYLLVHTAWIVPTVVLTAHHLPTYQVAHVMCHTYLLLWNGHSSSTERFSSFSSPIDNAVTLARLSVLLLVRLLPLPLLLLLMLLLLLLLQLPALVLPRPDHPTGPPQPLPAAASPAISSVLPEVLPQCRRRIVLASLAACPLVAVVLKAVPCNNTNARAVRTSSSSTKNASGTASRNILP